ncbi:MAG: DUF4418 family protein [Lachnospiraceae bacterium]|nr:DUF4418 family protein [Lachnospiraceae bacterium]
MKTRLLKGLVYIVLGLIASLGVATVFHVCPAMKDMVMKCHWTGRVSIAVGIGIIIVGILTILAKERAFADGLAVAAILLGILLILLPTVLIGVCPGAHMHCHAATRPALIITGALTVIYGGFSIVWKRNKTEA